MTYGIGEEVNKHVNAPVFLFFFCFFFVLFFYTFVDRFLEIGQCGSKYLSSTPDKIGVDKKLQAGDF